MATSIQVDPQLIDWMREIRRRLHAWPETAYEEFRTSALITEELRKLGLNPRTGVAKTGVVAEIGQGEPLVALRADMDALPINEETGLPFASKRPGFMHACGHDGHVAMLLGAAALLLENKPQKGRVRLIFQPAEEKGAGALAMIREGVLEGVSYIFAGHIDRHFRVGEIAVNEGLICAYTDDFFAEVQGKGGHAAWPQEAIDAIVVASFLVTQLQTLISREVNPAYPCVVTVGKFHGGSVPNAIVEKALLEGTIRSTQAESREKIHQGLKRMAQGLSFSFGAQIKVDIKEGYPPVINDSLASKWAQEAAKLVVGEKGVVRQPHPSLGGEDFAFYLQRVPGCLVRFGAQKKGLEGVAAHSSRFDFDEGVLPVGASFLAQVALVALEKMAT